MFNFVTHPAGDDHQAVNIARRIAPPRLPRHIQQTVGEAPPEQPPGTPTVTSPTEAVKGLKLGRDLEWKYAQLLAEAQRENVNPLQVKVNLERAIREDRVQKDVGHELVRRALHLHRRWKQDHPRADLRVPPPGAATIDKKTPAVRVAVRFGKSMLFDPSAYMAPEQLLDRAAGRALLRVVEQAGDAGAAEAEIAPLVATFGGERLKKAIGGMRDQLCRRDGRIARR